MRRAVTREILDVENAIQQIIRGNVKNGIRDMNQIYAEGHAYLSQWQSINWFVTSVKGIVETIRRYETDELKFGGRSVWILYMMLEYGQQPKNSFFTEDVELLTTLVATLIRNLIEHSNYNICFLICRILLDKYSVKPHHLFSIGTMHV